MTKEQQNRVNQIRKEWKMNQQPTKEVVDNKLKALADINKFKKNIDKKMWFYHQQEQLRKEFYNKQN